jgi:antitoxin (DNA-binding transcriptional repressor) of toxin-antitoxin stability system
MVFDHGTIRSGADPVEQIAVSKFKATCLSVLQRVHKTRKPVVITRFGVPIAEIGPPPEPKRRILGCMAGSAKILGDIVGPTTTEDEWDALRD